MPDNIVPAIAKIVVDRNLCIGAGTCVAAGGGVFELDDEQKAVITLTGGVRNSGPATMDQLESKDITDAQVLAAAQSCPTAAIFLYDAGGNTIFPA